MAADEPDAAGVRKLVELILSGNFHNVVVMAGAGISVAAGIPDFRSPSIGLYATISSMSHLRFRSPTFVFDIGTFRSDARPFWWTFSRLWPRAGWPKPTTFHYFLNLLHRHDVLLRCFTQNIDGLEEQAGLPADKVVYAHGVLAPCHCLDCGGEVPLGDCVRTILQNAPDAGDYAQTIVPRCPRCGHDRVKPDVVFFGENLPRRFFELRGRDLARCDLLIVSGTSLEVWPFAGLPAQVRTNVPRFVINRDAVRRRGGTVREFFNTVKSAFTFGMCDFGGVFDYNNGKDWFIGGDLQQSAGQVIAGLGWDEEFQRLKAVGDAIESPVREGMPRTPV
jgi:NAD-dependent SIR2 family protein deacetylase